MKYKALAIWLCGKEYSREKTERVIMALLGRDSHKDDHGHWYKTEGAPCPHRKKKPENSKESGGISGAKKTDGWEERHAKRFYGNVRKRSPYVDAKRIARHCKEFSLKQLEAIRQHMFVETHDLDKGNVRFDPDPDQAQAWQRLTEGRGTDLDVLMLKHELEELTLMRRRGYNYDEAHEKANRKYNWWEELQKAKEKEEGK